MKRQAALLMPRGVNLEDIHEKMKYCENRPHLKLIFLLLLLKKMHLRCQIAAGSDGRQTVGVLHRWSDMSQSCLLLITGNDVLK